MYFWSHAEVPAAAPPTPGRLTASAWPPASPVSFSTAAELANAALSRPGARYTEAGMYIQRISFSNKGFNAKGN